MRSQPTRGLKVFVDANVLIRAARGTEVGALAARSLIHRKDVHFLTSRLLMLEVLPKPIAFRQDVQANFFRRFFESCELVRVVHLDAVAGMLSGQSA